MTDMTGFDRETGEMPGPYVMNDRFMRLELRTRELEDALEALRNDVLYLRLQLNDPSIVRRKGFYDVKSNDCIMHVAMSRAIPEMEDPTDLKTFEERARQESMILRCAHDGSHPDAVRAQGIADAVETRLRPFLDWFRGLRLDELWCRGRAWRHQSIPDHGEAELVSVEIAVENCTHNKKDNAFRHERTVEVDGRDDEAVANAVFREAADALCTRFGVTYDERAERNRRLARERMSDRWRKAEEERMRMRMEDAG